MSTLGRVAVVGAGLAGSVAAWRMAQAGLRPVLFERETEPGAGAACGGVMLHSLGCRLEIGDVADGSVDTIRIQGVRRPFTLRFRKPVFVTFDRARLDRLLALRAEREGTDLRTGCRVVAYQPELSQLSWSESKRTRSERFDTVVFADGPLSRARSLGLGIRPDAPTGSAFYRELETQEADCSWIAFDLSMAGDDPGYYWIFPKRDALQVGVGRLHYGRREPLRHLLDRFIAHDPELEGRPIISSRGGVIPFKPARAAAAGPVMVVGDAAGLVNPVTGGGLVYAAASGEMAAEAVIAGARRGRSGSWAARVYSRRLTRSIHMLWLRALQIPFSMQLHQLRSGRRPYFLPLFLIYARVLPRLTPLADAVTLRSLEGDDG